jgi:hypothetical protein
MAPESGHFVPKVHPATRPVEAEDPMSLHATSIAGDPDMMLQCLVHEYAWLGWDADHILGLFRDPFYPALHDLLQRFGEDRIRRRLHEILSALGVLHFEEVLQPDPEPEHDEPALIELGVPLAWRQDRHVHMSKEGGGHGQSL